MHLAECIPVEAYIPATNCSASGCGRQGDGMGSTHLPSPGFDRTELDRSAGAFSGEQATEMVQPLGPDGKLGSDPVFSDYGKRLEPEQLRGFYADMAKI